MTPRPRVPDATSREVGTVAGCFFVYGAIFFDRLAPLYVVALIATDLGIPSAAEGTLAMLIGAGWAAAMPIVRATSGRLDDRTRVVIAATVSGLFSIASAASGGWIVFVLLRGLGGLASASGAPAVTALTFSVAPAHRRGLDLGIVQSATRVIGSLVSPAVITAVAVTAGWRPAMVTSGILLLVGAALLLLLAPGSARHGGGSRPASSAYRLAPGGRRNIVLSTVACIALVGWLMVWSQSAVPLVGDWLAMDAPTAGRMVGLFGLGAAVAALLVPMASDRLGRRLALGVGALLGGSGGVAVGALAAVEVVPPRPVVVGVLLLAGVAMGGLPLVISIIPAESVASGDVARALIGPIAASEVVGGAALPAVAAFLAVPLGLPVVVAAAGTLVLGLVVVSALLRPLEPATGRAANDPGTGGPCGLGQRG